jgi:hypothetical protein
MELHLSTTGRAVSQARRVERQQKDELCAAFCVAVVVNAMTDQQVSQDDAAAVAGAILGEVPDPANLPPGSAGRRDYLRPPPTTSDTAIVGTSASGTARALAETSDGLLSAIPLAGPWDAASVGFLLDLVERPDTAVILNAHTSYLWDTHLDLISVASYLDGGDLIVPPCEWSVGHFVLLLGSLSGAVGSPGDDGHARLAVIGDTYPTLGSDGVHLQPVQALVDALARPKHSASGGAFVVTTPERVAQVRAECEAQGFVAELWDNGTPDSAA